MGSRVQSQKRGDASSGSGLWTLDTQLSQKGSLQVVRPVPVARFPRVSRFDLPPRASRIEYARSSNSLFEFSVYVSADAIEADEFLPIEVTMTTLAFFSPGPWQFIIVLMVILVLFGNRLPSVMRSLGEGITEFKKGIKGIKGSDADTNGSIEDHRESP